MSQIEEERNPNRSSPAQSLDSRLAALVVAEDASVRGDLQARMDAQGYACDGAADANRALLLCSERAYDVVLYDLDGPPPEHLPKQLQGLRAARDEPALIALVRPEDPAQFEAAWQAGLSSVLRKPPLDAELRIALRGALETRRLALEKRALSRRIHTEVLKQTKELLDTIQRLERVELGVRRSQEETIYRLSRAAEYRDNETGRHLQRMSHYSGMLARKFGLSHDRSEIIRTASPMHDVGKIGVSDLILYKKGRHTAEEFEIMKQHAQMGYEILRGSQSELLDTAATIAWTHHEKFDGSGYPRGLNGREIPLEGRIVAIADVFDALTSKRVYKPAFPLAQASQIMNEGRGKHFDPGLLDLFWECLNEVIEIQERYTDPELPGEAASAE